MATYPKPGVYLDSGEYLGRLKRDQWPLENLNLVGAVVVPEWPDGGSAKGFRWMTDEEFAAKSASSECPE